jgi:ABC-2 type transport system permease protein
MFPWEAMPAPARWLSMALPLTHYLRVIRGVVLKGASLVELRYELFWLIGLLTLLTVVASLRFRKKLD